MLQLLNFLKEKRDLKNKHDRTTAVWKDCEFCGKFTFTFRKKYFLNGKYSVPKFATDAKRGNVEVYTYSDKSYVMILCGANADLFDSIDKAKNRYYRKEVIKGMQFSFGNVKSKRLEIFNIAFDQMKKK